MHYLDCPSNVSEWKSVAQEFESKWDFPHAVGTLDGKHMVMQAPHNSGSAYFNYKKTHSIALLVVCNAKYEFTMVDTGDSGRQSDGSVYNNNHLAQMLLVQIQKIYCPMCLLLTMHLDLNVT